MEFDQDNVGQVVEEDRLSNLPDDLIHKILYSFEMKFVVQTCVLSSRWEFLWTSIPCLNLSSWNNLPKFSKFVTNVLSHRNHQIEVSSVKLYFRGARSQVFVSKIVKYAFSHDVQVLTIRSCSKRRHEFPSCLFSSKSLKHLTLSNSPDHYTSRCITPRTPWDFPALTTLHLSHITLCDANTGMSVDIFSKCVSLKNLTLEDFSFGDVEVFDIITPRLYNLMLKYGSRCSVVINLIAPQLEKLRVISCNLKYLNAPPGLSSLYYCDQWPLQLSEGGFHSLIEVTLVLNCYDVQMRYKEEDARKTINMLQELHSVRYLTLNVAIVECISSFPELLLHHSSPFSNLISLTINPRLRNDAGEVKLSTEARSFFFDNSPNATFIS